MASFRAHNPTRPWMARRKRNGIEYVIGLFSTKAEAVEAEQGFDSVWPSNRGWLKGLRRHIDYQYNRRVAN